MRWHQFSVIFLYVVTLAIGIWIVVESGAYDLLPLVDRPHSPQHALWKPGGPMGHGLGVIGSLLMLLLLLYSIRKRARWAQSWGSIRYWLNYHIWMGVTGPMLIVFHTTLKFNGIVAISFWSMIAVFLSGVLGRYIYVQIPRNLAGQELTDADMEQLDRQLMAELHALPELHEESRRFIDEFFARQSRPAGSGWAGLWIWFTQDLIFSRKMRSLRQALENREKMSRADIRRMISIISRRAKLRRKMDYLASARALLHHWHIIHRPFAVVMLLIMLVHVGVAIAFGYHWIF
jgi:hypothetical protein